MIIWSNNYQIINTWFADDSPLCRPGVQQGNSHLVPGYDTEWLSRFLKLACLLLLNLDIWQCWRAVFMPAAATRRAETGAESVEVISCWSEVISDTTPNLECKIVRLLEACWRYNSVSSVELMSVPIRVFPKAICSLVELIRDMRFGGRRMTFIGLANTLLDDSHALLIAGARRSQMILKEYTVLCLASRLFSHGVVQR